MKFRTIYILFNIVIVVSFVFVFLLPFFLLGWDYSISFWRESWYLAAFFLALLALLNGFFLRNWKVFSLVEREDWGALAAHLVQLIFTRRRYGSRQAGLLVDAYLLLGDVDGIERLEEELRAHRPRILAKLSVLFGLTRLLRDRPAEAESFLAPLLGRRDVDNWEWLRFDYAFALVMQRKMAESLPHLIEGSSSRDPVLALLAAYLLGTVVAASKVAGGGSEEAAAVSERVRLALGKRYPGDRIRAEVSKAKGEFQVVVMSRLIEDAEKWLAGRPAPG